VSGVGGSAWRRGRAQLHARRGGAGRARAQHLAAALARGVPDGALPAGDFGSDGVGGVGGGTLVLAPAECVAHRTAPEPIARGGPDPPPENVNRLHVLTHAGARAAPARRARRAWAAAGSGRAPLLRTRAARGTSGV
jgi:hypothetical protein